MDKKSLCMLLIASSFASSTFATNILNKLIMKHSSTTPSIVKTHKTTNKINRPYTDFSGTWTVNCGDNQMETTIIENDANYITLDGMEFRIGQGLQGMSQANEEYASYQHNSFEWNANGSALTMKGVDVFKDHADNSAILTYLNTFTLTMNNGQINLDGKMSLFEDETPVEQPLSVHCVFSKKQ